MSTKRLVLGQQNDGTYGLRATLPGYDAFVGDGSGAEFTFNSDWTDIAKIHQVGVMAYAGSITYEATTLSGTLTNNGYKATFSDPGYFPFVELRKIVGNVVYDDNCTPTQLAGFQNAAIRQTYVYFISAGHADWNNAWNLLYTVYKVQIPVTLY